MQRVQVGEKTQRSPLVCSTESACKCSATPCIIDAVESSDLRLTRMHRFLSASNGTRCMVLVHHNQYKCEAFRKRWYCTCVPPFGFSRGVRLCPGITKHVLQVPDGPFGWCCATFFPFGALLSSSSIFARALWGGRWETELRAPSDGDALPHLVWRFVLRCTAVGAST